MLIFIVLSASIIGCSSLRIEKRKYLKGFFVSTNRQQLNKIKSNSFLDNVNFENKKVQGIENEDEGKPNITPEVIKQTVFSDTVIIYLKNGNIYKGVITEEKENGIFLQVSPDKNIFINRVEIDRIVEAQTTNQNLNNTRTNKGNTKEDYYTSGRKAKKQPKEKEDQKTQKNLNENLPRETKKAKTYFTLAAIFAFIPLIDLLSIVFFLIGASYEEKGYKVAKKEQEKYDMGKIFKMHETTRIILFILKVILIMILTGTLILLIVNSL